MKNEKHYLLTYYRKNTDNLTKKEFSIVPCKTLEIDISEQRLLPLIEANFKKHPFLCSCTVMTETMCGSHEYELEFTIVSSYYKDNPIPSEHKPMEADMITIDDYMNRPYLTTYEPSHQGFEVKLEHEEKVIRLGSYFYNLKGVLICEATEEDKKKYHCDRYITFPIVEEDWRVYDEKSITYGMERLIVGKKGDTILLEDLKEAIDYNAREDNCEYDFLLGDLERHGITISNRKRLDSPEELPETVVIEIDKLGKKFFRMDAASGGYYIPQRFFYVGEDDELYVCDDDDFNPSVYRKKLVTCIVEDVTSLSWFFNKPNLRVLVTALTKSEDKHNPSELGPIPKDWFYTVQTLESEINYSLDEVHQEYPDNYYRNKRPDNFEEK